MCEEQQTQTMLDINFTWQTLHHLSSLKTVVICTTCDLQFIRFPSNLKTDLWTLLLWVLMNTQRCFMNTVMAVSMVFIFMIFKLFHSFMQSFHSFMQSFHWSTNRYHVFQHCVLARDTLYIFSLIIFYIGASTTDLIRHYLYISEAKQTEQMWIFIQVILL